MSDFPPCPSCGSAFAYEDRNLLLIAFLVIVVVSRMDRSARAERERAAFDDQFVRAQTGLGAAAASSH